MKPEQIAPRLRFYFITDHSRLAGDPVEQVQTVLDAGATAVQYRNKDFSPADWEQARRIQALCRRHGALFLVNDHLLLAKALAADGVHLGQDDCEPALARKILGPEAVIGLSVSDLDELDKSDLAPCDYVGSGPVFATATKTDAKPVRSLHGLAAVVAACPLPVVAIGGITAASAPDCLAAGAVGVAVISYITRAADPRANAVGLAKALGLDRQAE